MPRRGGQMQRKRRNRNQGHRMHRRPRLARILANRGRGRGGASWGRWAI